jgi:hypothetical protein
LGNAFTLPKLAYSDRFLKGRPDLKEDFAAFEPVEFWRIAE